MIEVAKPVYAPLIRKIQGISCNFPLHHEDSEGMEHCTYRKVKQKYEELVSRSFSPEPLPKNVSQWERLVDSGALDKLPAGIALLDYNFRLKNYNKTYESYMLKHSPTAPGKNRGRCIFSYLPGLENTGSFALKAARDFKITQIELGREINLLLRSKQIRTIWDAYLSPLTLRGKERGKEKSAGVVLFCLDQTDNSPPHKQNNGEQQRQIHELKTAIRVLNELRVEDRIEMENKVYHNTSSILVHLIERLEKSRLDGVQQVLIQMIKSNVNHITSGFSRCLSDPVYDLTSREIIISDMIRAGRTTKEMAEILCISTTTIEFHRRNIRKKLGLTSKSENLRTFLLSIS